MSLRDATYRPRPEPDPEPESRIERACKRITQFNEIAVGSLVVALFVYAIAVVWELTR